MEESGTSDLTFKDERYYSIYSSHLNDRKDIFTDAIEKKRDSGIKSCSASL